MVQDIRSVEAEKYWEELRRRWGALLSYRYIGRQFSSMNSSATDDTVTLRHDMRNPAGGIMAAPLSISCPGGGGRSDFETVPNPVIHSLHVLDAARGVKRIEVIDGKTLKSGARMDFGRATIVDADDHSRVIALVESQSAAISEVPEALPDAARFADDPIEHIEDSPDLPPLWKVFGGQRRPDGHWTLPELREEFASPDAILHVGPQFVILEQAAMDAAGQMAGTDRLQIESWHVMFFNRATTGPFRADTETTAVLRSGRVAARVLLHDEGNGDRATTEAAAVFRVID